MNHANIENLLFYFDNAEMLMAIDQSDKNSASTVVVDRQAIGEQFKILLQSAPALYQALTLHYRSLQVVIDTCLMTEAVNNDMAVFINAIKTFAESMQNNILLAQRIAQVGMHEVANSIQAQNTTDRNGQASKGGG